METSCISVATETKSMEEIKGAAMESVWQRVCAEYNMELPFVRASFKGTEELGICVEDKQSLMTAESGACVADYTRSSLSTQVPSERAAPQTCSAQEYIEDYIYPVLLPGMAEMLSEAKREGCYERKQTKFLAFDFLTEWLYNLNPKRKGRPFTNFFDIPFVHKWLQDHPRPPMPLSLLLSEEEATKMIQSFWRGYRVRCDPEVQQLRQWQKDLHETNIINKKVQEFWLKQETKVEKEHENEAVRVSTTKGPEQLDKAPSPSPENAATAT